MRDAKTLYGSIGLLAALGVLAWACSLDSPTAPRQNPPPPGGGTIPTNFRITVAASPDAIGVNDPVISGQICGALDPVDLEIEVRDASTNQIAPNGTTVELTTNLGSFEIVTDIPGDPTQEAFVELSSGKGFLNFYPCSTVGTANVRATLGTSVGKTDVEILPPVTPIEADFDFVNSDGDLTVQFQDLSTGLPTAWSWSFGDGDTSNQQHPMHEFSEFGDYVVTLTASRPDSAGTVSKLVTVAESAPPV